MEKFLKLPGLYSFYMGSAIRYAIAFGLDGGDNEDLKMCENFLRLGASTGEDWAFQTPSKEALAGRRLFLEEIRFEISGRAADILRLILWGDTEEALTYLDGLLGKPDAI